MIFVTTGTQLKFERLENAVLKWCEFNKDVSVELQTKGRIDTTLRNLIIHDYLTDEEFIGKVIEAEVVVAHAGVGSILCALLHRKKIIVCPRRFELNEHRNNHQVDTVAKFKNMEGLYVVDDMSELHNLLDNRKALEEISSVSMKGNMIHNLRLHLSGLF